jgi:hypothetical protein
MSPHWQWIIDFGLRTLLSGGIAAALVTLIGKKWLAGVEAKHTRELESLKARYAKELEQSKQLLQAEIDKTFLVTKVHFETEFQALREVFAILAEIRLQLPNLRPHMSIRPIDETREQRTEDLHKQFDVLNNLYNKLVSASENLSPFYPQEIYTLVGDCEHALSAELIDVKLTKDEDLFRSVSGWFDKGEKNLKLFLMAYTKVSTLIRERVSRLAIVRST